MKRHFVLLCILMSSCLASARLPSDTTSAPATCQLDGFSTLDTGTPQSTYVDVEATSLTEAVRQSISTQSAGLVNADGNVHLLKIEMGAGQSMWAKSITCGDFHMQLVDCCKAVCGACKHN